MPVRCAFNSVKNPQTFQKSWLSLPNMSRTISNMYTYPFKPQLLTKTQIESHDKKPKDQRNIYNIYTWPIVFQIGGVIPVFVRLFSDWSTGSYAKYILLHLT